ncbi:lipopolysaccharide biosynthesis protein [Gulosibacter chungangensis]|uniref:Oligosaccharide flippase family protein n=1 Tax=Gulosibacter chungangensis TaxID=979746 RepID=A0A7J5B7S1_9MICO|nr:hypothetical protein [Gulosibacter chungangensis]KAB1641004.1 hypothetical protein F8O05_13935 [Gulosibacter chungangensis]
MTDYIFLIFGKASSAAAQMVMLLFLASDLSAQQLSLVLAIYSLASIVASIGDLGLGTFVMRESSYGDIGRANQAIYTANGLAVVMGILGTSFLVIASAWLPALLPTSPLLLWAATERATETRCLRLIAETKILRVSLITAGRRLGALLIFFGCLFFLDTAWSFSVALLTASAAAFVIVAYFTPIPSTTRRNYGLIGESIPYMLSGVSGQLRNLDVPVITMFLSAPIAAAYGLGSRLSSPFMLVFSSMSNIILTRARDMPRHKLMLYLTSLVAGAVVMSVCGLFLLPVITSVLSTFVEWITPQYSLVIVLVACSYLFAGTGIIFGSVCVAHGLQRELSRVNLITVVVSLGLIATVSLIFGFGWLAACASLTCYATQLVTLGSLIWKRTQGR